MEDRSEAVEGLIGRLYRSALTVPATEFRSWALEQLKEILSFDAALWSSGSLPQPAFRAVAACGLAEDFPQIGPPHDSDPLLAPLLSGSQPIELHCVVADAQSSELPVYGDRLRRYDIGPILTSAYLDTRSGVCTLLRLFRRRCRPAFCEADLQVQRRLTFHLFNAASHAFFIHLMQTVTDRPAESAAAAVDRDGVFQEAQPRFLELLDQHFPGRGTYTLPFALPPPGDTVSIAGLGVRSQPFGELSCIFIWPAGVLDRLTRREREIVLAVAHGLSFKQAARRIGIAPSTVANHLYRIYRKLGVCSRNELAGLVHPQAHRAAVAGGF